MHTAMHIIAIVAVLAGTAFSIIGALGYLRLADVYQRLHAAGKVSVFGVIFLLIPAIMLTPVSLGNSLVFILLLLIAGPVGAHVLASAAYRIGINMEETVQDDLARDLYEADVQPMDRPTKAATPRAEE